MNNIKAENEKINKAQNDTLSRLKSSVYDDSMKTDIARLQFDVNISKTWINNVRTYLGSWNSFMGSVLDKDSYEWRMDNEYHEKYLINTIWFERPENSDNEFEDFIKIFYRFNQRVNNEKVGEYLGIYY